MVTVDEIATAVESVLAASSAFAAAVPGLAFRDRGPDTPSAYPYAVYHVDAGVSNLTFEDAYLQHFTLTMSAWVPEGVETSPADAPGVQEALFSALCTDSANTAFTATPLRNASEAILHAIPQTPAGEFDDRLRQGRDVFICDLTIDLLVQGDRSVP